MEILSIRIVNIVADFHMDQTIPLDRTALELGAVYEPEIHSNAYLRLVCGPTAILHKRGRVAIAGAKNRQDLANARAEIGVKLESLGLTTSANEPIIRNLVAVVKVNGRVDLLSLRAKGLIEFKPETFPGGYIKNICGRGLGIVYSSGSVVLTGLKSELEVDTACIKVLDVLRANYERREHSPRSTIQDELQEVLKE